MDGLRRCVSVGFCTAAVVSLRQKPVAGFAVLCSALEPALPQDSMVSRLQAALIQLISPGPVIADDSVTG